MKLDQRLDDGKTEAGSAVARAVREGLEALEDAVKHFGRDAAAAVADLEHDFRASPHRGERNRLSSFGIIDRVGQQVEQHLAAPCARRP